MEYIKTASILLGMMISDGWYCDSNKVYDQATNEPAIRVMCEMKRTSKFHYYIVPQVGKIQTGTGKII